MSRVQNQQSSHLECSSGKYARDSTMRRARAAAVDICERLAIQNLNLCRSLVTAHGLSALISLAFCIYLEIGGEHAVLPCCVLS